MTDIPNIPSARDGDVVSCKGCRFRLMIDNKSFHCAADPDGWAYTYNLSDPISWLDRCGNGIEGQPLAVGHELGPTEFWAISGKRIRTEDWQAWKT